jgi:protein-disulfide isomerase
MKLRALVRPAAAMLVLALPSIAPAQPAKGIPDWTRSVAQTPIGTYVLGNPRATTKIVEYFSYTCSHCAHFNVEGSGPLRTGWIRRGIASIEFRNAVRDPYDLTAALLARCGGKARFMMQHEALLNNFSAWMPKLQAYDAARDRSAPPKDQAAALVDIAAKTGLTDLLVKRGLPAATQRQCLADAGALKAVLTTTQEAWEERKISGTPAFLINDKMAEGVASWAGLKPLLPALPATAK